jgi:N-methylhydantoinase A
VFFDALHPSPSSGGDWVDTPTYDRTRLAPGDVVAGPAVIEEFGSTVPVHPGFSATVDTHGNLLLTRGTDR